MLMSGKDMALPPNKIFGLDEYVPPRESLCPESSREINITSTNGSVAINGNGNTVHIYCEPRKTQTREDKAD
jgi:hypothetical protein